ncbi:basic amino acid ABC transporter substrate-binding protein [Ornithinimicrobium humiphilum]|jgi:polar amino acid transport system substrate-binding protein|uniref:Amino acid ABC transporter substrate-binding protein (PAAT family) n=1 Tax=Ornithinimicrobium humiphilum TaxID=125288 RepID=A0A543KKX4_9MICO|nr:transporter substrate-binding domain-containing protein [Ornithinimicrobium humiphilum]TQM95736.1 amino acid ABC transporter substrate-binding protein (PAAT family) [Ornithinimicrobium humiphilum]
MNIRSLYAATAAAGLVLTLAACGSDDSNGSGDGDASGLDLVTDGTLTVCSDVPYAPFEDFDESSPSGFTGFDIDIVQAIADGLELDLVVKDSSFDGLQSGLALNAGDCDLAASAMTITEERKANLAFSEGYYDSLQSLLVPADSGIASIADLEGKRVGVQQGTTGEAYANENVSGAEIVSFPSDAELYQALQAGQVDALLQDLPVNLTHTTDGRYTIVEEYDTDETYGLAMKKDNTALVEAVNEQLAALRDSGEYDELYDTYFSEEAAQDAAESSDG